MPSHSRKTKRKWPGENHAVDSNPNPTRGAEAGGPSERTFNGQNAGVSSFEGPAGGREGNGEEGNVAWDRGRKTVTVMQNLNPQRGSSFNQDPARNLDQKCTFGQAGLIGQERKNLPEKGALKSEKNCLGKE